MSGKCNSFLKIAPPPTYVLNVTDVGELLFALEVVSFPTLDLAARVKGIKLLLEGREKSLISLGTLSNLIQLA